MCCILQIQHISKSIFTINSFHATRLFRYPLKTSENLWFSEAFREYRKRPVARNGLTQDIFSPSLLQKFTLPEAFHSTKVVRGWSINDLFKKISTTFTGKYLQWKRLLRVNFAKVLRTASLQNTCSIFINKQPFNPFVHNDEKWSNILKKSWKS